ncbi:tyrosine-protein kinase family protein [Roseobacter sinensis]|uniref:CpsD/CapB family tyrosine-protein kinase n=1 Tax=Roseobacter sinensis TaxID=2931391 RepID=A0ABT3BJR6_9RHOB|nr:CpsD/CapB family tyrosine-protein kinase [Roseobacter sp. WL0113]MCV3273807.1 CpsD/CapB family tyrosine-protein kinase [Roseobacter sp. WL0113]
MEKLQKALSKARQERGEVKSGVKPHAPRTRLARSEPSAVDQAWAALTPFEPDPQLLERNTILAHTAQKEAASFDILRTKIFLTMRENGWKRVAVTSPDSGSGKTTISCNLAAGFSRQTEARAMLLDADLRMPSIASRLGCTPAHDLCDVLTGQVPPQEQLLRLRDNVAMSLSSKPVKDPTKLLLSDKVPKALDDLQAQFEPDIMIFDLPPMLLIDDTRATLENVDCALIVVRSEQTHLSRLDVCEREVAECTNVLGVVLNDCRNITEDDSEYGYG